MRPDEVYLVAGALGVLPGRTSPRPADRRILFEGPLGTTELNFDEVVAEAERIRADRVLASARMAAA